MDPEEYIKNGTVVNYCLGLLEEQQRLEFEIALELYPMLKEELEILRDGLKDYMNNRSNPDPDLKGKIWNTLQNLTLEKKMDLSNLPLLNKYSSSDKWLAKVKPLLPAQLKAPFFARALTHTDRVSQVLIMTNENVPDEVHEDVLESFLLLEGECECQIGERIVKMKAGDYMEIPLHQHHDVRLLSQYVVAVMQRLTV